MKSPTHIMATIPKGTIILRDDRKKHVWDVEITPFLLGKYQVTQGQYHDLTGLSPSFFSGDLNPVESISWRDATIFCNLLSAKEGLLKAYDLGENDEETTIIEKSDGYRLPTDAEWEYACRADTGKVRYGNINDIAWYKANSDKSPHEVGTKAPNPWGLYDMLGNVWEWCCDVYDPEVYGSYRVFRGGGWSDEERSCLASNRRRSHPTYGIDDLGFRVARSIIL